MNVLAAILLAVLSIWDYPSRRLEHDRLRLQFIQAMRGGDTETMEETCRKGVKLLPDDPTWHYNLACSLAYFPRRSEEAFEELEKAVDLGFRDVKMIREDNDLKQLEKLPRYKEALEYAEFKSSQPVLIGPMATVAATGVFGKSISLGEQNLSWDFDSGCFSAALKLAPASAGGNTGDLYFNRDGAHALLKASDFPGLTPVTFDQEGRSRKMDLDFPNTLFPYPVFGNCSRALTGGRFWRSLPRALTTMEVSRMNMMARFYLSNQFWVYPSNADTAPVGTNGDVFASITPYWLTTAGRSFSDLPYLTGALKASALLKPAVKRQLVGQQLLTPVLMTLIRKSLTGVNGEEDYLTAAAHPTAMPPNGLDIQRLAAAAAGLKQTEIPPLAAVAVRPEPVLYNGSIPELTYGSSFAWAWVLRARETRREFLIEAKGAREYAFVQTHGSGVKVDIEHVKSDVVRVTIIDIGPMSPTNRVDIMVTGRNPGTGWGAPSYISFARMDPEAPYSDPVLTPLQEPVAPVKKAAPPAGTAPPAKQ